MAERAASSSITVISQSRRLPHASPDVERDIEKALIAFLLLTEDKVSDRNAAQIRTVVVIDLEFASHDSKTKSPAASPPPKVRVRYRIRNEQTNQVSNPYLRFLDGIDVSCLSTKAALCATTSIQDSSRVGNREIHTNLARLPNKPRIQNIFEIKIEPPSYSLRLSVTVTQ